MCGTFVKQKRHAHAKLERQKSKEGINAGESNGAPRHPPPCWRRLLSATAHTLRDHSERHKAAPCVGRTATRQCTEHRKCTEKQSIKRVRNRKSAHVIYAHKTMNRLHGRWVDDTCTSRQVSVDGKDQNNQCREKHEKGITANKNPCTVSLDSLSAPASSSSRTQSACPPEAANIRAVNPLYCESEYKHEHVRKMGC